VTKGSAVECISLAKRILNAVALQKAVLCVECDVISDSPHDKCLVCGSQSLFNISRVFGGMLPEQCAKLVARQPIDHPSRDVVLAFPKLHKVRRRSVADSRQLLTFDGEDAKGHNRGMLLAGD
jgi:hypothetical protein